MKNREREKESQRERRERNRKQDAHLKMHAESKRKRERQKRQKERERRMYELDITRYDIRLIVKEPTQQRRRVGRCSPSPSPCSAGQCASIYRSRLPSKAKQGTTHTG